MCKTYQNKRFNFRYKKIINSSSEIEIIEKQKKIVCNIHKKLQKRFKFLTKPTKILVERYLKNLIHEKRNA